jgi:hypothetical protein
VLPYLQQPSTYQDLFYKFFHFVFNVELFLLRLDLFETISYFKTHLLSTLSYIVLSLLIAFLIFFQVRHLVELLTRKGEFRRKLQFQVAPLSLVRLIDRLKQSMNYANLSSSGKPKITTKINACRNLCRYRPHKNEQISDRESRDTDISFDYSLLRDCCLSGECLRN